PSRASASRCLAGGTEQPHPPDLAPPLRLPLSRTTRALIYLAAPASPSSCRDDLSSPNEPKRPLNDVEVASRGLGNRGRPSLTDRCSTVSLRPEGDGLRTRRRDQT